MFPKSTRAKQIWVMAHPLQNDVGEGLDYAGRKTGGRISYGEAVELVGRRVVHRAIRDGWLSLPLSEGDRFNPDLAEDWMICVRR